MFSERDQTPSEDTDVDQGELKPSPSALADRAGTRPCGSEGAEESDRQFKDNYTGTINQKQERARIKELTTGTCLRHCPPGLQMPAGESETQRLAGSLNQLHGIFFSISSTLSHGPDSSKSQKVPK